jgi:ferredoxin-NADP reductase
MSQLIKTRVIARDQQGQDIVVISLASVNSEPLPAFDAGAHIDLHLGGGIIRQYSLCGSPRERHTYRLGILKTSSSRGGAIAAHALAIGDEIEISQPRNLFPLVDSASHSILIGGGIGITPMLAMADVLQYQKKSFELHYCGRSSNRAAFTGELANASWNENVHFHFQDIAPHQKIPLASILAAAPIDSHIFVCGPEGFMDWVFAIARESGLSEQQLHKEYFNKETETSGNTFTVYIENLDIEVQVKEDQTITQALADAGVRVKVSCQQGVCGTCLANVIAGTPDHRDSYLTTDEKAENDQIILCCSRAISSELRIEVFEVE